MSKTAIITGISGQDGSYLANLLLTKNYNVIGLTRSIKNKFLGLEFLGIKKDILIIENYHDDYNKWKKLIHDYKVDEIYNLSSLSSVGESFISTKECIESNFFYFKNLVDIVFKINPEIKFFQASSSEMFGNTNGKIISENMTMNPISPYGLSKLLSHNLAKYNRKYFDRFISTGILFNHESCLRSEKFVFKKIINYLVKKQLGIADDKLRLGNISVIRDWGYAPKYVEAMWLINNYPQPEEFIICSSEPTSLENILKIGFNQINLNYKDHIIIDKKLYRPAEIKKNSGDNSKAKDLLNWNYNSDLDLFIQKLIEDELKLYNWRKKNNV